MSRLRIVYATKTNHSKKLAQAIGEELNVQPDNVIANPILGEVDLLYIVGGIYGGKSLSELLEFVKNLDSEKIKSVALVTSCVSKKQGQDTVRKLLENSNIPIVDELICQGSFLFMRIGHPNKKDIQEAVDFAVRLSDRIKQKEE